MLIEVISNAPSFPQLLLGPNSTALDSRATKVWDNDLNEWACRPLAGVASIALACSVLRNINRVKICLLRTAVVTVRILI